MLDPKPLILVVDDVPKNIQLLRLMLEPAGYAVIAASSGAMALQLAQEQLPALILLDLMMPEMDGFAVCQRLKETGSTKHIPVIFVTARDDMQAESRCFAIGAADYIAKPISLPVVLARVKAQLALALQRRSLEGMFRDVIEFAPDAFILADSQGRIVRINARAEQMFGYPRLELIGQPVEVLIPPRLRHQHVGHREANEGRGRNNPVMGSSLTCLHQDGSEFPADINLSPLQTAGGALVMAVVRDVTERQRADVALAESRQLLRQLLSQNETVRETERKHLAREVHDELGQMLTALRMDLSMLEMRFGQHNPALTDKVGDMKTLMDRVIQGVRQIVSDLRPTALDVGLIAALQTLCTEFAGRTGIDCTFVGSHENLELDESRAVVVFRIAQESLTNIMRHAQATKVSINAGCSDNTLTVAVCDNGCGFDTLASPRPQSFGLAGMRERALALGGVLDIASAPKQGTTLTVSIPIVASMIKDLP